MNIKGIALAGLGGLLLVWLLLTFGTARPAPTPSPADIEREAISLQTVRIEATATAVAIANATAEDASQQGLRTSVSEFWLVLLIVAPIVGGGLLAWRYVNGHRREMELVYPSAQGLLPVSRRALLAGAYDHMVQGGMAGYHTAQIEGARRPIPAHTYSPTITVQGAKPGKLDEALAIAAPVVAGIVPDFDTMLDAGLYGKDKPLILGYEGDVPLIGDWKDLYSAMILGLSGSGKSTTMRYLAASAALKGAKLAIVDWHINAGEESTAASLAELRPAFLVQPPATVAGMLDTIKLVQSILDRRVQGDPDRSPIVFLVGEYAAMIARGGELGMALAALLEAILIQGRKVNVIALCATQNPKASRSGGTEVSKTFTSYYIHRTRRSYANMVVEDSDDSRLVADLGPGQALLGRTNGENIVISIPNTPASVMRRVGQLLLAAPATTDSPSSAVTSVLADALDGEPAGALDSEPAFRHEAREVNVIRLYLAGSSLNDICAEVYSTVDDKGKRKPVTGDAKMKALTEINAIIRDALARGGPQQ